MDDIVIRPSLKFIRASYVAILVLLVISVALYYTTGIFGHAPPIVAFVPALLLLWPLKRHLQRQFTRMTISGDKLRYETGMFSRHTRNIQISKVQDVRFDQTVGQRMMRIGDLSLETAGETSLLVMKNVDSPDQVAEDILRFAHTGTKPL